MMTHSIKAAVIGGSGKSGTYLVAELLKQGYYVKLLLRNPAKAPAPHPLLQTVTGTATDPQAVRALLTGCSVVLSTLGLGVPPSEPELFANATANILSCMQQTGIKRYIVTTGLNVDTPSDQKSKQCVAATDWMKQRFPVSTASKQQEYELLQASTADWTLVRLPLISLTNETFPLRVSLHDCPGEKISATDLARFLIAQLHETAYIRQAPFIASE